MNFINGKLKISPRDNEKYGNTEYSSLPESVKEAFMNYEISVDLMTDASDEEVLETFARLNTYTVRLNKQELRNARYYGQFKRTAYRIAHQHLGFFQTNGILSGKQILRMADAELVSELLVAMLAGLQDKKKSLEKFYKDYDEKFDKADECEDRFRVIIEDIKKILGSDLERTRFRRKTMFYSVFCVFYDFRFGLPPRVGGLRTVPVNRYANCRRALRQLNTQIEAEVPSPKYQAFFNACKQQTDNIQPRQVRHDTILTAFSRFTS